MADIHPTAVIDPSADLADNVRVGPLCVIEPDVSIGPGSVLLNNVTVRRYTSLGANNTVDSYCVLGGWPQDYKFDPASETHLRIGDGNTFREGVTINRATTPGGATTVGSNTFWMANSHAGHDVTVHDRVVVVNGCCIAGHATIHAGAILSANGAIHQYTWIGERVMFQGGAMVSSHVPPFALLAGVNNVVGLNVVGLRRAQDLTDEDRRQVREAFNLLYRSGLTTGKALERMEACSDWGPAADGIRRFVRKVLEAKPPHNHGLCRFQRSSSR